MFPTKTSRDVGMVDRVSDATGSSMEKPTGGKSPGKYWKWKEYAKTTVGWASLTSGGHFPGGPP